LRFEWRRDRGAGERQPAASADAGTRDPDRDDRTDRRGQLPRPRARVQRQHDRKRIAFLAGAGAGGRLASRVARPLRVALAIEIALIALACALAAAIDVQPDRASGDTIVGLLAVAMGVRNATVRKLGVPDLTTTVLTMTLTGLAADSPAAGGTGTGSVRRAVAVSAMFAGAVAGALLVRSSLVLPLLAAAALGLVAMFVADG
jgi:uncharacterized membrane protein YoaK (UPF0700 family)